MIRRFHQSGNFATLDHVVPKVWGGGDGEDNLVYACRKCNQAKGNTLTKEFIEKMSVEPTKIGNWETRPERPDIVVWAGGPGSLDAMLMGQGRESKG
jgi:CRISPR/Cas system Type II protein with McrA/HNH and RuvC-like nuclease domain